MEKLYPQEWENFVQKGLIFFNIISLSINSSWKVVSLLNLCHLLLIINSFWLKALKLNMWCSIFIYIMNKRIMSFKKALNSEMS